MSINATLSYNTGLQYTDLFPKTNVENIIGDNINRTSFMFVNIPVSNQLTQTISISPTTAQSNSLVFLQLINNYEDPMNLYNYRSISQFEVTSNSLIITRNKFYPVGAIDVALIFVQNDTNFLNYTTIDVTIPSTNNMTQTISISPTESQVICPVYMDLVSEGAQAIEDYATISQFEVTSNSLIITRLGEMPSNSIEVTLLFKQGGYINA